MRSTSIASGLFLVASAVHFSACGTDPGMKRTIEKADNGLEAKRQENLALELEKSRLQAQLASVQVTSGYIWFFGGRDTYKAAVANCSDVGFSLTDDSSAEVIRANWSKLTIADVEVTSMPTNIHILGKTTAKQASFFCTKRK